MGQLETYTIQDIFLVAILSGVLSTYFAEEIEATIESVAAYTYSANYYSTRKRVKSTSQKIAVGDVDGVQHNSFNFLNLFQSNFLLIEKPIDDRPIWQDPFLRSWSNLASSEGSTNIEDELSTNNA